MRQQLQEVMDSLENERHNSHVYSNGDGSSGKRQHMSPSKCGNEIPVHKMYANNDRKRSLERRNSGSQLISCSPSLAPSPKSMQMHKKSKEARGSPQGNKRRVVRTYSHSSPAAQEDAAGGNSDARSSPGVPLIFYKDMCYVAPPPPSELPKPPDEWLISPISPKSPCKSNRENIALQATSPKSPCKKSTMEDIAFDLKMILKVQT